MEKKNKTILIMEDEKALQEALKAKLGKNGFNVISASDGKEGLEIIKKEKPDMVILDVIMPNLDGIEVLRILREEMDEWGKTVPVFVLTNVPADDQMIETIVAHEPAYYLVKSDTTLENILEKLEEIK